jgi:hypothetical protein
MRTTVRREVRGLLGLRGVSAIGTAIALLTLASLSLAAPAGAAKPFPLHGTAGTPLSVQEKGAAAKPASTVAPLTLAILDVTNNSTGATNEYQYSDVAQCAGYATEVCLNWGDSGSFSYQGIGGPGLYQGGTGTVVVRGIVCSSNWAVELDQYVYASNVTQTAAVQFDCSNATTDISGSIAYNIVPTDPGHGYYVFGQQGELTGFGNDNYLVYLNGAGNYNLNAPIVGMAATTDGGGYWMVGSDGGVYSSGDAPFYGSTGNLHLNKPIVGMAATPDGKGYWFVGSDGGIFSYGDAQFYGSTGSIHLNKPIVGMAATPSGNGYWLVASDGGIFAYGDAQFYGSTGSLHLNKPVVGLTPTPDGGGYWFVASDGGIFAYGDAHFYGSTGAIHLNEPIVGMTAAPGGTGYWFVASDGGIFNYGSAPFAGSLGGLGITDVAGLALGN